LYKNYAPHTPKTHPENGSARFAHAAPEPPEQAMRGSKYKKDYEVSVGLK
jgi:hypothetical protein